jgi:hypothetical protein
MLLYATAYWLLLTARRTAAVDPRRALSVTARRREPPQAVPRTEDEELRVVAAAQRAVRIAERCVPFRLSCLERSIALHQLCARSGVATDLRIGVRKQGSVLEAHAWVEYNSAIFGSAAEHCRGFQPLNDVAGQGRGD